MLTDDSLDHILHRIPSLSVAVLGDLFLDRYLDIDAALTEPSIETGLDAYQVVGVRSQPGAAGTVINNLVALGVRHVAALSVIGDDGEGYELHHALDRLKVVDCRGVLRDPDRRTPTYTKPMLCQQGQPARELNRLDIKNRTPLSAAAEEFLLRALEETWPQVDALLVLDQTNFGVLTDRLLQRLAELGDAEPDRLILADSRERIGRFRSVWLKPNQAECARAVRDQLPGPESVETCALALARRASRPVFCTCGDQGILLADPRSPGNTVVRVPAYPVTGPLDIVGAGDSTSAAIACAVAAGAGLPEAAAFGNLIASITIQQLGTTGTATPTQVRQRWQEVRAG
jgi:rfaE bifunctional protein kinase chain/domain